MGEVGQSTGSVPIHRRRIRVLAAFVAVTFLASTLLTGCASLLATSGTPSPAAGSPSPGGSGGALVLNEFMSSNSRTWTDASGATPDWIELKNEGGKTLHLKGYGLSDDVKKPGQWVFPDVDLAPGAYLLVFADGTAADDATVATASDELHASFRLGQGGDEVVLTDPGGNLMADVTLPELPADISYGRVESSAGAGVAANSYVFFGSPTPGRANEGAGAATAEAAMVPSAATVQIREVMSHNSWTLYDEDGDSPDWVEIANTGTDAVDLSGFGLSTALGRPFDWTFPAGCTLAPGGLLVLLLSGKDTVWDPASGRIHVSFRLGGKDALLRLVDRSGLEVDRVVLDPLPSDVSKGRRTDEPEKWAYFPLATPGGPNDTVHFDTLDTLEASASPALRSVVVSEALPLAAVDLAVVNGPTGPSGDTVSGDWVELFNASASDVDLTGYGLSDSQNQPFRQQLSDIVLASGGYVQIPVSFGLAATGDRLFVTDPTGRTVDVFDTARMRAGMSCGRLGLEGGEEGDGAASARRVLFETPTPGKPNTTAAYVGYAAPVTILVDRDSAADAGSPSADDGLLYCTGTVTVTLSTTQAGGTIRYTTDGSAPTAASPVLDGQTLTLKATTVLRALVTCEGRLPSFSTTRTFLFDAPHDLPVVCLSLAPEDFESADRGIWTNYYKNWERSMHFTFYEADGTAGASFDGGVRLNGDTSRKQDQKSMEILLKSSYGADEVTYPFFPGLGISTFSRLILRTSGQDWKYTKIRDAFMTNVVAGRVDLSYAAVRPCVVYVNGRYWGLYEVREKLDRFYLASHFGVDPDKLDLVKGDGIQLEGTRTAYQDLIRYAADHDLRVKENYDYVVSRLDETSLMDFIIVYSFFTNRDTGNKKVWRTTDPVSEFKFCMYDFDWAIFPTTWKGDLLSSDLFDPEGHGAFNIFHTDLQVKLVQNPLWRDAFIARYEEFLDTTFATDRMLGIYDQTLAQITSEMPRQIARWGKPTTVGTWSFSVDQMRDIVAQKNAQMRAALERFRLTVGG